MVYGDLQFFDLIIFAAIAVFIIYRLRSVLGKRTGFQKNINQQEFVKKETKQCPSCHIPIYKISGCDQMWCTVCKVAFSWRTGARVNGVVHNPHFYQWQRDNNNGEAPRVAGDNPCENLPDWRFGERLRRNIVAPEMNFLFENICKASFR